MRQRVDRQSYGPLGEHHIGTLVSNNLSLHKGQFGDVCRTKAGLVELMHERQLGGGVEVGVGAVEGAGAGEVVADGHGVGVRAVAVGGVSGGDSGR